MLTDDGRCPNCSSFADPSSEHCWNCDYEYNMLKVWYIHKYEVWQRYGGPEEGGWWYNQGEPTGMTFGPFVATTEAAYDQCRWLNEQEHKRRERDNRYGYTSVLSYRDTFYEYDVTEDSEPNAYPVGRPHYE